MVVVCFLDSAWLAQRMAHGQWLANGVMLACFCWMYRSAPPRLRGLMKYGVVVAAVGEVIFSLVIGMYEYRLGNVPVYVPPGHVMLFGAVYYLVREPFMLRHQGRIMVGMGSVAVAYAGYWLVARDDVYGALCTLLFLVLLVRAADSRYFFLAMFLFVGFLEQVGTGFGAWHWHASLLGKISWLPSGNPPSGISVFYFGFDVACLMAYLVRRRELRRRYQRAAGGVGTLRERAGNVAECQ
jgi:hypothetical protein